MKRGRPRLSNCERITFTASQAHILTNWFKPPEPVALEMSQARLLNLQTGTIVHQSDPDFWMAIIRELDLLIRTSYLTTDGLADSQRMLLQLAFERSDPTGEDRYVRASIARSRLESSIRATARKLARLGIEVDPEPVISRSKPQA